jgi:hypothetical protein
VIESGTYDAGRERERERERGAIDSSAERQVTGKKSGIRLECRATGGRDDDGSCVTEQWWDEQAREEESVWEEIPT